LSHATPISPRTPITQRLIPIVLAGGIGGVIATTYGLAFGAIVFAGPLAEHLPFGLGLGIFTAMVVAGVTALFSSLPGIVGHIQSVPAILLSLSLATILTDVAEAELLPTAITAIAVATFSVGLVSLLLGLLKLGEIIRYVPFPVIGGFLGGSGWFLTLGALLLMTGLPEIGKGAMLLQPGVLIQWLPGLAFALAQLWLMGRYSHPLTLPGLIVGALGLFYLVLLLVGSSAAGAADLGLLLGPFAGDGRWQHLELSNLTQARWDLIIGQGQSISVLLGVTLLALLLNISGLEVVLQRPMDLNQELRATGLVNLASALGGGLVGFHGLALSALCHGKIGGHSRWVGILAALVAAFALVFGSEVIGLFPRFVLGGLVLSLGLSFLREWLWQARRSLPPIDYAIVVAITLTMGLVGVLPGVGLGLTIAIATFLINYSRIAVVRHRLSGQTQMSSVARAPHQQGALHEMGDQIQILKLQGYLFFGTANQLLDQVKQRLDAFRSPDLPQFMVLDFQQVTGMDSSVVYSFIKLKQQAQPPLRLVLTHLRPEFYNLLSRQGCLLPDDPVYHLEPSLDSGLAWCEGQLLDTLSWRRRRYVPLPLQLQKLFADPDHIPPFMDYLDKRQLAAGELLFEQGQSADQLYFLESGQVSTFSTVVGGAPQPDHTYQPGTVLGATAFSTQGAYPVRAVADQPSTVYGLSRDRWQAMVDDAPKTAAIFQEMLIKQLSDQLLRTSASLKSLLA
jgi:sulfate permease, SulP family